MYECSSNITENEDGSAVLTVKMCKRAYRVLKYKNGDPNEVLSDIERQVASCCDAVQRIALSKVIEGKYQLPSTEKSDLIDFELDRDEAKRST